MYVAAAGPPCLSLSYLQGALVRYWVTSKPVKGGTGQNQNEADSYTEKLDSRLGKIANFYLGIRRVQKSREKRNPSHHLHLSSALLLPNKLDRGGKQQLCAVCGVIVRRNLACS